MAYPKDLLSEGEAVELDAHSHWASLVPRTIAGGVMILVIGTISHVAGEHGWSWPWVNRILAAAVVGWILWWALGFAAWWTTEFVVTSNRVILRSGILARNNQEIPLARISSISTHQSVLERTLGFGTLVVESASRDGVTRFRDVAHVAKVAKLVRDVRDGATAGGSGPAPASAVGIGDGRPAPVDLAGQIERLAALHESGKLSDGEFQAAKSRLIAGS